MGFAYSQFTSGGDALSLGETQIMAAGAVRTPFSKFCKHSDREYTPQTVVGP